MSLFFQSSLAIAGQEELKKALEQDMQYYERIIKPSGRNAQTNFLNRVIQKYEDKDLDSMYLISVEEELKTVQQKKEKPAKDNFEKLIRKVEVDEMIRDAEESMKNPRKKSRTKSGGSIKFGMDTSGKHKVSGAGLSGSEAVDNGTSVSFEIAPVNDEGIGIGAGITYQLPRNQKDYEGKFNFVPIYGLIKICSPPSEASPYFIGQLGYNLLYEGDKDYTGEEMSLSGGTYYGIGAGLILQDEFQIEVLYSVNKGEGSYPGGYVYGWYVPPFTIDVEYSKISLSIGFCF